MHYQKCNSLIHMLFQLLVLSDKAHLLYNMFYPNIWTLPAIKYSKKGSWEENEVAVLSYFHSSFRKVILG